MEEAELKPTGHYVKFKSIDPDSEKYEDTVCLRCGQHYFTAQKGSLLLPFRLCYICREKEK